MRTKLPCTNCKPTDLKLERPLSSRTFHRTIITIEVLSEYPYSPDDLDEVVSDITDGDCSGKWSVTSSDEVDGPTMAKLLIGQESDPEFFQLDEDGNDTDNDDLCREHACRICGNIAVKVGVFFISKLSTRKSIPLCENFDCLKQLVDRHHDWNVIEWR